MTGGQDPLPTEALEDVAYLSRSANRIVILDALSDEPATRRELTERTGSSRTTLDRIVNELEDRGWAERTTDGEYVATAAGTHLMAQFRPFMRSVEALRQLGGAVSWLPTDELTIGLEAFADASVRRPERDDPVETVEFMTDLVREASSFRVLTDLVPPEQLSVSMHDGIQSGRLSVEVVVPAGYLSYIREHPARFERWRENVTAGAEVSLYDGSLPCNLWIADDVVLIKESGPGPIDESYGVPIVSRNEAVRSWAHELIDRYRADSTELELATVDESASAEDR